MKRYSFHALPVLLLAVMLPPVAALTGCAGRDAVLPALEEVVRIEGSRDYLEGDVLRPETRGDKCPVAIILNFRKLVGYMVLDPYYF